MSKRLLKVGDTVMVIAGGNKEKKVLKGKTAKILKFVNQKQKVVLEGLNLVTKHKKPTQQSDGAIVKFEAPMDISNVMFYVEKLGCPVRLCSKQIGDKKVRGYKDPKNNEFVEIV